MVKINRLEIENTKRIKAVRMELTPDGITVIGGKNEQGKTSVLDAIAWALGGDSFKPSQPEREGSENAPYMQIVLSNGLVAERKGKNSALKVTDPAGKKGGQQILNEFVSYLALDLPKFMDSNAKEKADVLLKIIGVGEQLDELERQEKETYAQRLSIGQIADQKAKFAKEILYFPDAPLEPVSATELIIKQQAILAKNGENQLKRANLSQLEDEAKRLEEQISALKKKQKDVLFDLEVARKSAQDLHDESTEELRESIKNIEEINQKVRINHDKTKAEEDARTYSKQYEQLSQTLEDIAASKKELLTSAYLPLPELSVEDGELIYKGFKWDNLSASEQIRVATAIVRKLNPQCGFVLLDKLEQMDAETLSKFDKWVKAEGLQVIATRVSSGGECSIIIEDGKIQTTEDGGCRTDEL